MRDILKLILGARLITGRSLRTHFRKRRSAPASVLEPLEARELLSATVAFAGRMDYTVGTHPQDIATADFNNDGLLDLAVTNKDSSSVSIYYGQAGGGFGGRVDIAVTGHPVGITAADFNSDGHADLAVATGDGNSVAIILSKSTGGFSTPTYLSAEGNVEYVTFADLNHEGHLDIAATVGYGTTTIHQVDTWYGANNGTFTNRQHFDVGGNPLGLYAADLNNDGLPDLVVASGTENLVSVLYNKGQCSFFTRMDAFTGTGPQSVVAADFNGDGVRDLAVADAFSGVSVIDARTYGTFNASVEYATPLRPFDIAFGDFNVDGKTDLIVTVKDSNEITMLYGQAGGSFVVSESYAVGAGDTHLVTGDFNRDGKVDVATVNETDGSITVLYGTGGDHAPVVSNINKTLNQDSTLTFASADFTGAFADPDAGDTLTKIKITALPSHGTLKLAGAAVTLNEEISPAAISTLTYTNAAGYFGADSFGWNGSDAWTYATSSALVNLTINHVNHLPTLANISKTINQDTTLALAAADFTGAFSDADSDALQKIKITALPGHGTLKLSGAAVTLNQEIVTASLGNLVYTPAAGYSGSDTIGWNASDPTGYAVTAASLNITIVHVNHAPTVGNISKSIVQDTTLTFAAADFTAAFADSDGDALTKIKITSLPASGTLKLNGTAVTVNQEIAAASLGTLTYAPAAGFIGSTSFGYDAADASVYATSGATVSVTMTKLNHAPTISNLSVTMNQDTALTFTNAIFTGGFTDSDGDALTKIKITSLTAHGTLTLSGSAVTVNQEIAAASIPNLIYTPTTGYFGSDTFGWNGADPTVYATTGASVNITINHINHAPTVANISKSLVQDTTLAFATADFTGAFTDPDAGDTLTKIKITTLPASGTLKLNGTAVTVNQEITAASLGTLTYTPASGFFGSTTFTYNAADASVYAASGATANLTITKLNHAPTVSNIAKTLSQDTTLTFAAADFTGAFTDPDAGDTLTKIKITTLTTHGTLKLAGIAVTANQEIAMAAIPTLTYTPAAGYTGADSFGWNGADASVYAAANATVNLTVSAVAHAPAISNVTKTITQDTSLTFAPADFTAAFSDLDSGDTMSKIKITSLPAIGALKLSGVAVTVNQEIATASIGNLVYTPNANTFGSDAFGWNGADSTAKYANIGANVILTITHVNHAPTVAAIAKSLNQDTTLTFAAADFAGAFSDIDVGDTLQKIKITSLASHGTLKLSGTAVTLNQEIAAGSSSLLTYTPTAGYVGADTFGWNAADASVYAAAPAAVNLTINKVNHAPTVTTFARTLPQDTTLTFAGTDFTAAFTDPDAGDTLQKIKIAVLPVNGTLKLGGVAVTVNQQIALASIGSLTYTPNANTFGTDVFNWNATDGTVFAAANAAVNLTITHVNHLPTLANIAKTVQQDTTLTFSAPDFTAAFTDIDAGDTLQKIKITALPGTGTLKLAGVAITLNQEIAASAIATLTYVPAAGYTGPAAFAWNAADPTGYAAATALVNITVAPINHAPAASSIARSLTVNTTLTFTATDFTAAFTDPDAGDSLQKIKITALPTSGVLRLEGAIITTVGQEIPTSFIAGLTYTPNIGYTGPDSFGFNVSDGQAYAATSATVTLTVGPINHLPTLSAVTKSVAQDAPLTLSAADFVSGFADADGDALQKIKITTLPTSGVLKYNGVTQTATGLEITMALIPGLSYTPNAGYTGTDSFGWNGSDPTGYAVTASVVNLNIAHVNHAPTVADITNTFPQGTVLVYATADFTSAFTDADAGDSLQMIKITTLPTNGTLRLNGSILTTIGQEIPVGFLGGLTYTPNGGFGGSDSFGFNASDGTAYAAVNAVAHLNVLSNLNAANPGYLSPIAPSAGNPASFFDQAYYLQHNPDVAVAVAAGTTTALQHFLSFGQFEGRAPSTVYNEAYYLAENPDVAQAVANHDFADGFQQYVAYGYMETRLATQTPGFGADYVSNLSPKPGDAASFFDEAYYLSRYPDIRLAVHTGTLASGLAHFMAYGQNEGRSPSSIFNEAYYLAQNPDIAAQKAAHTITSGFQQFINQGFWDGLIGSDIPDYKSPLTPVSGDAASFFDEVYYLESNPDIRAAVFNHTIDSGLTHFLNYGQFEGRSPSTLFNETYYLAANPDVAAAVANHSMPSGFFHFVNYGFAQGRLGAPA